MFLRSVLLVIHISAVVKTHTMNENYADMNEDDSRGLEGNAFFALRSCHQVLHGDSGEFFSPDYLCSSPALWCNWTIKVQPGKRVQLYLEDLTPEHSCHLKMDQIHLDEFPVAAGESQILERCWQRARYTSISNTLHVVQLIGPNPNPPHRGFYGQYHAFGPPEPPQTSTVGDTSAVPEALQEEEDEDAVEGMKTADQNGEVPDQNGVTHEPTLPVENMESVLAEPVDATNAWTNEIPVSELWERSSGEIRKVREGTENQATTAKVPTGVPSAGGTDLTNTTVPTYTTHTTGISTSTPHTTSTEEAKQEFTTPSAASTNEAAQIGPQTTHTPNETPTQSAVASSPWLEDNGDLLFVEVPSPGSGRALQPGTVEPDGRFGENNIKLNSTKKNKPSNSRKGNTLPVQTFRNPVEPAHLPGDFLLEVTVEVDVHHSHEEDWGHGVNSFKSAVENMIQESLESFKLKSISAKRFKKLNVGVLLIVWVQFKGGDKEGLIQSTLQQLKGKTVYRDDQKNWSTFTSVSVEDIDECRTQMIMCDVHAECVNEFGSYSCHCRHGYSPGLGGAVCVAPNGEDCSRTVFPMLLYVVCVLLCVLIALLMVVLVVFYRRYHRGAFLPHGRASSSRSFNATSDSNNNSEVNGGGDPSSRPLPPPPPLRVSKEASTVLDFPLLKFSPLEPPEESEGRFQKQKDQP